MPLIHTTTVSCDEKTERNYPVVLRDAKSLLVSEQKNQIPRYSHYDNESHYEVLIEEAFKIGSAEGEIAIKKYSDELSKYRNSLMYLIKGMQTYFGNNGLIGYIAICNDLQSKNPAIKKSSNPDYSFEITPKTFSLGLTGRVLTDGKENYEELLNVETTIYDTYNLAVNLCPKRITAVDHNGKLVDIYSDNNYVIGKSESFIIKRNKIILDPKDAENYMCDVDVLDTGNKKIVENEFYNKIKEKYQNNALMFGHKYNDLNEFVEITSHTSPNLIWKLAFVNNNNSILHEDSWVTHDKRCGFIPDEALLDLGNTYLKIGKSAGYRSLMMLDDSLHDIWIYRTDSNYRSTMDIILDKKRNITIDNPVSLNSEDMKDRFPVLKEEQDYL